MTTRKLIALILSLAISSTLFTGMITAPGQGVGCVHACGDGTCLYDEDAGIPCGHACDDGGADCIAALYTDELDRQAENAPTLGMSGIVTAFDTLEPEIENQTVPYASELSDITLPNMLAATVREHEIVAPADAGELREFTTSLPVKWQSAPEFNGYEPGEFIFTATVIDDKYSVQAETPVITVTVEDAQAMVDAIMPLATGPNILGGAQNNGDLLEVTISGNGGVVPRKWGLNYESTTNYSWQRLYYSTTNGNGLSLWNDSTLIMQGGYFIAVGDRTISLGPKITDADGSETITRTWTGTGGDANGIVIFETFRLEKGARFYTRDIEIKNNSGADLNNLRLYIGGDVSFSGSDTSYGDINIVDGYAYCYRADAGVMILRGVSPLPSFYHAANYNTGRTNVLTGQNLLNITHSISDNIARTDTGYYIQWGNRDGGAAALSIPGGGSITIQTSETFLEGASLVGSVAINGVAKLDETLTANIEALTYEPNIFASPPAFFYQWKHDNEDIADATSPTYIITEDDIGKAITVTVTAQGCANSVTSGPVAVPKFPAPTILWPSAGAVTYGAELLTSPLNGGSTEFGSFAWTNGAIIPAVTNSGYSVTFTPSPDTLQKYDISATLARNVNITVNRAATTGVDQTYEAVKNQAREYSFDLTWLLPDLSPLTLGAVTYSPVITADPDGVLGTLSYISGNTLTLPVNDVDAGKTATVTVTVSSSNYADFTADITVRTVDAPPPVDKTPVDKTPVTGTVTMNGGGSSVENACVTGWLGRASAQTLANAAKTKGQNFVRTKSSCSHTRQECKYGVRADAWDRLGGLRYEHDTLSGGVVQVRVYINNPAALDKDTLVSGWLQNASAVSLKNRFERFFENKLLTIRFDHAGEWGQTVRAAARLDTPGMDAGNLVFYAYDRQTNLYRRILNPNYRIDANGYVHFDTSIAGDIIISGGPLARR